MTWRIAILTGIGVFWLAAGILCFWLPARLAPPEPEVSGPEISTRRWSRGRIVGAAVFVPVTLLMLLAGLLVSTLEVGPVQPPDFDSDTWAAECSSSVSRQSVSIKKRQHTRIFRCESFTGAKTLWRIYTKTGGEEIEIEYQLTVEEGRGDLVLVEPDGTVTRLSGETSPCTFTAREGETRLRLIGDQGKLEYTVTLPSLKGQWMD